MAKVAPAEGQQLALALEDAQLVQHRPAGSEESGGWRGYCTINHRKPGEGERLREIVFPVAELPWFLAKGLRQFAGEDLYIAQHSYAARQRRTGDLLSLNLAHVDLDTYKSRWSKATEAEVVAAMLRSLEEAGVPAPSYVVASGRGLQVKWLWSRPLPAEALPRWQAAHRWLVREGGPLDEFGADGKAILPTQILRVVGSVHQVAQVPVRVVWTNGKLEAPLAHDFDAWCKEVLPYSREQVRAYKARMAEYSANVQRLAEDRGAVAASRLRSAERQAAWSKVATALGTTAAALGNLDDLVAGEIWQRRLRVAESIAQARYGATGGVPAGERHEWLWVGANALAWVNRGQPKPLLADVCAWARKIMPSYSQAEVKSAAGAVLKRAETGDLYRMAESTFRAKLGITEAEMATTKAKAAPEERWDIGAMGFERMSGLSYEEYVAETKRRQSAAGARTAASARAARAPLQAKATQLRAEGLSYPAIAKALGVSVGSVYSWIKGS